MDESLLPFIQKLVILFVIALIGGCVTHILAIVIGNKFSLYARPSSRRLSNLPIPRSAGIAFSIAFPLLLIFGTTLTLNPLIWFGFAVVSLVGLLDDYFELPAMWQAIGMLTGITLTVFGGVVVNELSAFSGGYLHLPLWLGMLIAILWFFLVINSINWFDGMDGLAGGVSSIAILFLALLSFKVGQYDTTQGVIILLGITVAFLLFNLPPAKLYLGSMGVYFIGFWIAFFAIQGGAKIATTALVLLPPIVDALITIIRRFIQRKPIHLPDANHGFHTLLRTGMSQKKVLVVYYSLTIFLGTLSFLGNTISKVVMLVVFIIITGLTTLWLQMNVGNKS